MRGTLLGEQALEDAGDIPEGVGRIQHRHRPCDPVGGAHESTSILGIVEPVSKTRACLRSILPSWSYLPFEGVASLSFD